MIASCDTHRIPGKVEDIAAKMETLMDVASRDDEHLLSGPQGIGEGLKQDEVGRMLTGRAGPRRAGRPFPRPAAGFAAPDPLTFTELEPVKRATLFG